MNVRTRFGSALTLALSSSLALLGACGSDDPPGKPTLNVTSAEGSMLEVRVDAAGAVLELEGRARVTIPPDALAEPTTLRIRTIDVDELRQRPDRQYGEYEQAVIVEPHGLKLREEATLELPVGASSAAKRDLRVLRLEDEKDRTWEDLENVKVAAAGDRGAAEGEFALRRDDSADSLRDSRRTEVKLKTFSVFLVAVESEQEDPAPPVGDVSCEGEMAGSVCRPAAGDCDAAEVCDGDSPACPPDSKLAADTVCREAAGSCDVAAACDGDSDVCPPNAFMPAETTCDDGLFCTETDVCDGEGSCVGAGDPCLAGGIDDEDDDCSESCNEDAGDCTGANPDGLACTGLACAISECSAGACSAVTPCPVFVESQGSDVADCGSDWGMTACASPQFGSDEAARTGNPRVFVRNETFTPPSAVPVLTMADGIAYYGGFAGTENSPDERVEPLVHTILEGNGGNWFSPHVVVGASDARLDGFTVQGGDSPDFGGGMYNTNAAKLVVSQVNFQNNRALNGGGDAIGGGVYNDSTEATFQDVLINNNNVQADTGLGGGAGMASDASTITLNNVRFIDNIATGSGTGATGIGAGLYDHNTTTVQRFSLFDGNRAVGPNHYGGGYAAVGNIAYDSTLTDVQFAGNSAADSGTHADGKGAGMYVEGPGPSAQVRLTDVRFSSNSGRVAGGGLASVGADLTLSRVSFTSNSANGSSSPAMGGGMFVEDSQAALNDVRFQDNYANAAGSTGAAGSGGGLYARTSDAGHDLRLEGVDFLGNIADASGFSPATGGGLFHSGPAPVTLVNIAFVGNAASGGSFSASAGGGAAQLQGSGSVDAVNLTVVNNRAVAFQTDPALVVQGPTGSLSNTVMLDNFSSSGGEPNLPASQPTGFSVSTLCTEAAPAWVSAGDISGASAATAIDYAGDGRALLAAGGGCLDSGDSGAADAAFTVDWRTLSTHLDGTLDTGTVDPGRHYEPAALAIRSFEYTGASEVSWDMQAPAGTSCVLNGDGAGLPLLLTQTEIAGGSIDHGGNPGLKVTLVCVNGGRTAQAETELQPG